MPTQTLAGAAGVNSGQILDIGVTTQIGTGLNAAAGAVNTPSTPAFVLQPREGGGGGLTLDVHAVPTPANGTITTLTVNLLASYDGGTTWQIDQSSGAMGGTGIPSTQFKNLVGGPLYALCVATLALGTATSFNLDGAVS